MTDEMPGLKLTALDAEDLEVISAQMQDATLMVGDISYLPKPKKLVVLANRFCWESAATVDDGDDKALFRRCRCGLQINRVFSVKYTNVRRDNPDGVLSLLAVLFHPGEAPGGVIELTFSGGGAIRAEVECIEVALDDLDLSWETPRKPTHSHVANED